MVKRIKLFSRWFQYWRSIDDGFSFVDDLRSAWCAAKKGLPVPGTAMADTGGMADERRLDRLFNRALCWWLGCEAHPQEQCHSDSDMFCCLRCGAEISYGDLVGDTRHNRAMAWARYWLWRKWWPEKCSDCGGRWKHDDTQEHLPF